MSKETPGKAPAYHGHLIGDLFTVNREKIGGRPRENFEASVQRASRFIENQNTPLTSHVTDAGKRVPRTRGGSIRLGDYHLSRTYTNPKTGDVVPTATTTVLPTGLPFLRRKLDQGMAS